MGNLKKQDLRHLEIKRGLMEVTQLMDVSYREGFGCDLIAAHVTTGMPQFLEIKGERSRNRLTDSEKALRDMFPWSFHVVTTVAEAYTAVGFKPPVLTSDHARKVL